jgi:hypothetical protein
MSQKILRDSANTRLRENRPAYQKLFTGRCFLADKKDALTFDNAYGLGSDDAMPFVAKCVEQIYLFTGPEEANRYLFVYNEARTSKPELPQLYVVEIRSIYANVPLNL